MGLEIIGKQATAEDVARSNIAKAWEGLSDAGLDYIEGPYQFIFDAVVSHLDKQGKTLAQRKALALAAIDAHGEPTQFIQDDAARLAAFNQVKADMVAMINAIPES